MPNENHLNDTMARILARAEDSPNVVDTPGERIPLPIDPHRGRSDRVSEIEMPMVPDGTLIRVGAGRPTIRHGMTASPVTDALPMRDEELAKALESLATSKHHEGLARLVSRIVLHRSGKIDDHGMEIRIAYAIVASNISEDALEEMTDGGAQGVITDLILMLADGASRAPLLGRARELKVLALEKKIHALLSDMAVAGLRPTRVVEAGGRKIKIRRGQE